MARLHDQLQHFLPLVMQVIAQAQRRVLDGQMPPSSEKVLSLFEPHTRLVTRHKGGAAVEFGRQVEVDEIDGGIVTRVHVLADDESERHQALPAVQHHRAVFGRAPTLVTGDQGTHTKDVEIQAIALGVR